MIKNRNQLIKSQEMLSEIRGEINAISARYVGTEQELLRIPLEREKKRLISEIDEFNSLQGNSLESSITTILSKPILIGNIGPLLAKLRIASNLTQSEMADRIGWEQANISRFERENYSSQSLAKIIQYANSLGVYLQVIPTLSERAAEFDEVDEEDYPRFLPWLMRKDVSDTDQDLSSLQTKYITGYGYVDPDIDLNMILDPGLISHKIAVEETST